MKPPKPEVVDSEKRLAQLWLHKRGDDVLWLQERKQWLRWRNTHGWRDDLANACLSEVVELGDANWCRVNSKGEPTPNPTMGGRTNTGLGALRYAGTKVATSIKSWDANPELVGVHGAMVINLRSLAMEPMKRTDRIRQQVPCIPDYNVPEDCHWRMFLHQAVPDPMTREFLLRLAGYSLTGYSREHVIPFLFGPPRVGKSTLYNAIREAIGDYGTVSSTSNYQKMNNVHRTFYAKLATARAVFMDEIPRGYQLNEGLVKSITGGEPLEANFMRSEPFDFLPRFTMWMIGNNTPTMSERDGGLLERIKVIKFEHRPTKQNKQLAEILRGVEQKYVIADIITAAAEYLESGLGKEPLAVVEAGKDYEATADTLSLFLSETVEPVQMDENLPRKDLWEAYKSWCQDAKQRHPYGKNGFFKALREGDYRIGGVKLVEKLVGQDIVYPGIDLNAASRHYH